MNHMAEVAKMLGVEIGKEFKCNNGYKYVLTENGIIDAECVGRDTIIREDNYSIILCKLLNGTMHIIQNPWKPNRGDIYWHIDQRGNPAMKIWGEYSTDYNFYKIGNCYHTEIEALKDGSKWVEFYASDEVLD